MNEVTMEEEPLQLREDNIIKHKLKIACPRKAWKPHSKNALLGFLLGE